MEKTTRTKTQQESALPIQIKVIGVGGGGCNTVNDMMRTPVNGITYIAANTDIQSLDKNNATQKIQLGHKGTGAGMVPEDGRKAAEESKTEIEEALSGTDLLFITSCFGGGTGTGATPLIAEIAHKKEILTIAIIATPFDYEIDRFDTAAEGIEQLRPYVDALIVMSNAKLSQVLDPDISVNEALSASNDALRNGISGIVSVLLNVGTMNVDFADIRTIMSFKGTALMGFGKAEGSNRAQKAIQQAISNPLLDNTDVSSAKGLIVYTLTAPNSLKMRERSEISAFFNTFYSGKKETFTKFGFGEDERLAEDEMQVVVIATGLQSNDNMPNILTPVSGSISGNMERVFRSGRSARSANLTAASFSDQAIIDAFDSPAIDHYRNEQ